MSVRSIVIELSHELPVVEAGLRQILGAWPEFEVRPPFEGTDPARDPPRAPDVLILDPERALRPVVAPNGSIGSIGSIGPVGPVATLWPQRLIVAMDGQELDVRAAVASGVRGVLLASCSVDEIVRATRAVAAGHRHLCAAATLRLADTLGQPCLTLREGEVLSLVLRGQSNKEMARSLAISVGTIKAHMRTLFSKLGARCRTEALWIAAERGLLTRPAPSDPAPVRTDRSLMAARTLAPRPPMSRLEAHPATPTVSKENPCPSPLTPVLHPA
ncbi:MAG: response regulator transcription factor [Rubrivivax sp.]|nr:MAG: response regulator transcription factor [Rubrivivax sp.]